MTGPIDFLKNSTYNENINVSEKNSPNETARKKWNVQWAFILTTPKNLIIRNIIQKNNQNDVQYVASPHPDLARKIEWQDAPWEIEELY